MKKITTTTELRESILLLEVKQEIEGVLLKEQFSVTYESLKPINLIKKTLNELTSSPDFKGDLLKATLSLSAGYLSKRLVVGATVNPVKQLLGSLIQMGVTSIVSKNTDGIKSVAMNLLSHFLNKKDTSAK